MYLYFLRVVFTVVKVVKVSSQSFSHCFIVICICSTKATSRDAYARSFFPQKCEKCASRERRRERFFATKKNPTIKFERRVPQKTENLSVVVTSSSHAFDFIRFFCLCLSPLLSRVFFRTETITMTFTATTFSSTTFRWCCFEKTPSLPSCERG